MPRNPSPALGERQQRTLRALVPIVCPPDVVTAGLVDDVVAHVDASAASFAPLARQALSAALLVIEASGLRHGRRRFSDLGPEAAAATVARLTSGSPGARRLVRSVRDVIVVAYFDQPVVKERLGYRPADWTAETAARWRQEWGADAERHRELLGTRLPRPGAGP